MATHTFRTMGTVASLIFDGEMPARQILAEVEAEFRACDQRFSLYRDDSEISRLNRGELTLDASSPEFREAYALAAEWRLLTQGSFTPERPDRLLDLSGVVKALAIEKARTLLVRQGISGVIVDVGGDGVAVGRHQGGPWIAGVVDPADPSQLLCTVALDSQHPAIATSGTTERGEHIWRSAPNRYVQVTVRAPDIITADVLATAIVAGGPGSRDDFTERWEIDVLTVDREGSIEMTPGMLVQTRATASAVQ